MLGEQILDVAIAERKPEIQPDSVLNDLRWKSMAAVGDFLHLRTLPRQLHRGHAVYVTTPVVHIASGWNLFALMIWILLRVFP